MSAEEPKSMQFPEPSIRGPSRLRVSVVWLVPLVAALVGLGLLLRAYVQAGPEITISFKNAEGLEAGKTEVKYKDVAIGRVREIELSSDHTQVLVRVELKKTNADLAVRDTRFWVVRPRADLGGVSGLGTLLSGAYIGMDVGRLKETTREFEGLELPPRVTNDQQGGRYLLRADNLGSLNIGSPVYYRRIPVGSVVGFDLEDRGQGVVVEVFVEAPYNHFVTQDTRFWNASGVDLSVDASGVKVNTQSLLTLVAGGVAFQSGGQREAPVVEDNTSARANCATCGQAEPGASAWCSMPRRAG
jgi:paraquat-inducible protein B